MSARITSANRVYQLDRAAQLDERVTEEDVKDAGKLARFLMRLLADVGALKRRFWPRSLDFEDRVFDATGTTTYAFNHGFGGRVRYWVVEGSGFSAAPNLRKHSSTTGTTLVVTSTVAGTATVRIQEAG